MIIHHLIAQKKSLFIFYHEFKKIIVGINGRLRDFTVNLITVSTAYVKLKIYEKNFKTAFENTFYLNI